MMNKDLFGYKAVRKPRRVLMHMIDAGVSDFVGGGICAQFKCRKCGYKSEWKHGFSTATDVKRGIPCPKCNDSEKQSRIC